MKPIDMVGELFYIAVHRQHFGPYFIVARVDEVRYDADDYGNKCNYRIKVHKLSDPYKDKMYELYEEHWERDVWLSGFDTDNLKYRFIPFIEIENEA